MESARAPNLQPSAVVFQDGLGERRRASDATGADTLELLCLRRELTAIPSFEFALRERASRLANLRHTSYGRVRGVDRLSDPGATLAIVSESTRGIRLSNLLTPSERRPVSIDIDASLHLIRQLVSAVAMLHETAGDIAHGAIGPERIIITPNARVVIVEYVLGAALAQLHLSPDRYWKELRVALPAAAGAPRFDQRADVTQIGTVGLSLILGRLLHEDEYPAKIRDVLASAWAISARGGLEPLPPGLRAWLARALQVDARHAFASALDARAELDRVLSGDEELEEEAEHLQECEADHKAVLEDEGRVPVATSTPPPSRAVATSQDEEEPEPDMARPRPSSRRPGRVAAALSLLALSIGGAFAARRYVAPTATAAATGQLSITSMPAGAAVLVDGDARGVTPIILTLEAGAHAVELRGEGEPRTLPISMTAGAEMSQYVELPGVAAAKLGQLQVRTEPAGAQVTVDGVARGRSPLVVSDLTPGPHLVLLESDLGTVRQTVAVEAAATASLVVPLGAAEGVPVSGWITVSAPVDLQIYENKRLLGTSQTDRIMVAAGRHDIEIVNEPLGFRVVRSVQVPPGKIAPVKLDWPKGAIALNAVPWADVWIDGEKVGETPIGNLSLPIGPHEVIFRHPDLGEQRRVTTVSASTPARLSVDMRKKP